MQEFELYDVKETIMMQMGCERCVQYISWARAILYLYKEDKHLQEDPVEDLWQIFQLMSQEINALSDTIASEKEITKRSIQ